MEKYTPPESAAGDYYCSFGLGQPLRKYHVRLIGFKDEMDARTAMLRTFGRKWSMIYYPSHWQECPVQMRETIEIVIEARFVDLREG